METVLRRYYMKLQYFVGSIMNIADLQRIQVEIITTKYFNFNEIHRIKNKAFMEQYFELRNLMILFCENIRSQINFRKRIVEDFVF